MSIATLQIAPSDGDILIARMIETAPKHLLAREMIHNAIYADATEVSFTIEKDTEGKERLCIRNNGKGMTRKVMTEFITMFAHTNTEGGMTHGVGARLVGLCVSPAGMVVESCRDRKVLRGTLAKHGKVYGYDRELPVMEVTTEFTKAERESDWTRTLFYGTHATINPLSALANIVGFGPMGTRVYDPGAFANQTAYRYFKFPDGFKARQNAAFGLWGGEASDEKLSMLPCMRDIMTYKGRSAAAVYEVVETENHRIHYALLPDDGTNPRRLFTIKDVQVRSGFGGIVVNDEVYSVIDGVNWQRVASKSHLGLVSRVCAVAVELKPHCHYKIKTDRSAIVDTYGYEFTVESFREIIRDNRPQFILDAIEELQSNDTSSEELRKRLMEFLRSLNLSAMRASDGEGRSGPGDEPGNPTEPDQHNNGTRNNQSSKEGKSGTGGKGSPRMRITIPSIHIDHDGKFSDLPWGKSPLVCTSSDFTNCNDLNIYVDFTHPEMDKFRTRVYEELKRPVAHWPSELCDWVAENEATFNDQFRACLPQTFGFHVAAGIITTLFSSRYSDDSVKFCEEQIGKSHNVASHAIKATMECQKELLGMLRSRFKGNA